MTTQAVTVTLALNGLPDTCPHCDHQPRDGTWLLGVHNLQLAVQCPECFVTAAPVRAVAAEDPDCE